MSGSASAILCKSGCGRSRRILLFLAERVAASFCYGCGNGLPFRQRFRLEGGRSFPRVRRSQIQVVPDDFRPDGSQGKKGMEDVVVGDGFQPVGFQGAHHVRIA